MNESAWERFFPVGAIEASVLGYFACAQVIHALKGTVLPGQKIYCISTLVGQTGR
ncbi:MAG: hypothetical protein N3G20_04075 [Verrucomicrobiae bacterium]|nr:hypothetical protein [Verrucomicrobiae bacterium]